MFKYFKVETFYYYLHIVRTQRHSGEVFGASRTTHNIATTLQNLLRCSSKRVLAFVIAPPLILILRRARCPVNGVLP
jgi:hypothetical protein